MRKRKRGFRTAALLILLLLASFTLLGFFAVPPIARHYAVTRLSAALDRDVTIAAVEFNPYSLKARVHGLLVRERHSSQVFLSLDEVDLNLEYRSMLRRAPVLKQVTITRPYLHIARNPDGNSYNFSDLLSKFTARPSTQDTDGSPLRFSLNNIELRDGRVDFDDYPKRARHTLTEMHLAIPFISNLPDVVDLYVQPAFSAHFNGTPIVLHGRTKPFKETRETSIDLNVEHLELPRYVEYLPIEPRFRVASGSLDTRLSVSFVQLQDKGPQLVLRGDVGLEKLALQRLDGKPLLNLAALSIPVTGIDVLNRHIALGHVALTSPEVFVRRDKEGKLDWSEIIPKHGETQANTKRGVTLALAEAAVHDGLVHLEDETPAEGFRTDLANLQLTLRELSVPQTRPAELEAAFTTTRGETAKLAANLLIEPFSSEGALSINHVRLKNYEPYYSGLLSTRIQDGSLDLSTKYALSAGDDGVKARLHGLELTLSSLRMRNANERDDLLASKRIQASNAELDLDKRTLLIGELALLETGLNLIRQADGTFNATRIVTFLNRQRPVAATGPSWVVQLERAQAQKCRLRFTDLATKEPVRILMSDLHLSGTNLSTRKGAKGQISVQTKIDERGAVKVTGTITPDPVSARLDVAIERIALVPLQPYFTQRLNVLISSGDASIKGAANFALAADGTLTGAFNGNASLTDVASIDKAKSEDLLKWRSLDFAGVQYRHAPMALGIDQVALSEFFARVMIFPDGRLNLQNIIVDTPDSEERDRTAAARTSTAVNGSAARTPIPVTIGKVTMQGGDVAFTDLFIKPNYSADLSGIGGSVTGLSSRLDSAADVVLSGQFAKTAPVEIRGKINPLLRDLFLDLKANVRDIELGPLTPYSGKYVGYAIEKGKMSFDVAYKVEQRKLTAANRLVLNQLKFGGRIESPQATKLPVLLAVSLLKDRNGVIDVNLPISGSLDDPKFSIGGIVLRIIFNIIEKAVTAPFAMIAHLVGGGGGEELSYVEFDYGRAAPGSAAQDKLTKLQTALTERPALQLDITGHADAELDREGLRRQRFEQQVKAQKLMELIKQGSNVRSVDQVTIDPREYERYLRAAYKEAKFPKPRNALGFSKDLPVEDMEKLMLANIVITDDDLITLANQRAQLTKNAITANGKVPTDRVYLLAPKLDEKRDGKRKGSRVEFALKT